MDRKWFLFGEKPAGQPLFAREGSGLRWNEFVSTMVNADRTRAGGAGFGALIGFRLIHSRRKNRAEAAESPSWARADVLLRGLGGPRVSRHRSVWLSGDTTTGTCRRGKLAFETLVTRPLRVSM
jgi:hypothetical protein